MRGEVVDLDGKRREGPAPVTDFWFAQLDARLGRIEFVVARVEKQIWLLVCAGFALLAFELVRLLAR